jgi:hypothetical protein
MRLQRDIRVAIADAESSLGVGFRQRPFRTCKMDLVHRTSSILILYRPGPLLGACLSVM